MITNNLGKIAITPKGQYVAGSYERLDLVTDNGSSYLSLKDNNVSDLTVKADWMVVAEKGKAFEYSDFTPEQIAILKGDKGDPFLYSDLTPEQKAELQQPATDAIASIQAVELAVEQAEGLRQQAELNRQTNTATAIQNAETATTNASNAAILANEKADLANNAAILANEKAGLAATAATQANTARDGANSAAQSATNLVNSYATELNAVTVDTLGNTTDIRLLENVINSANINQETTVTVSGVDTVALPKTAANTGMQVQIFGDSDATKNVLGTGRVRSVGNNLIKPIYIQRFQVSTTDGTFVAGATFSRSDYFRVAASTAYILSSNTNTGTDHRIAFYDSAKVFISGATQTSGQPISVTSPANAYYTIVSSLSTKVDTFRLTRGTSSFEPFRQSALYLTTPELRSNGLIKDEIRKGINGYELVKRVGVGTLGSELVTNGDFTSGAENWNFRTGWSLAENKARFNGTIYNFLGQTVSITSGKFYRIAFTIESLNPVTILFSLNGAGTFIGVNTTNLQQGNYVFFGVATVTAVSLRIYAEPNQDFFIDNISVKEVSTANGIATSSIATVLGSNIHYTLATPVITPIAHAGLLNSNSNGTAYFEPIIADAGVYSSNLAIQLTDYPISSLESIRKYANGAYTELNTATAVIASGGLSFTHPDLASDDLVMFTYAYSKESIGRSMTLTHYDSRYVKADTANGKTYRIVPVVTNGVVSWTTVEV